MHEQVNLALTAGFDDYLTKPLDIKRMVKIVDKIELLND
jgi:DNA-binding response OmpR family regulator